VVVGEAMPETKREPGQPAGAKKEQQRVKAEKDSGQAKAEKQPFVVDAEQRGVKAERRVGVKAEQRVGVKAEQRAGVKLEQPARVKLEGGGPAASKPAAKLPPLSTKVEQLRNLGVGRIKAELLRQAQQEEGSSSSSSGIKNLVARGLAMRAKDQHVKGEKNVKREKGTRSRIKNLVKVKRERSRNKDGSLRKKPRTTAKRRRASREVMSREIALSEELGELLGAEALSRPEAVRRLWAYCRDHDMLNPDNKREIQFDTKLERIMGQPKANMPQLISLMMPHFDYTKPVVKQEAKREPGQRMKVEAKKEQLKAAKREMKSETKLETKLEEKLEIKRELKLEQKLKREHAKREPQAELAAGAKRAKYEPASGLCTGAMRAALQEALSVTAPRISSFDKTSAVIECMAPAGNAELEALATPSNKSAAGKQEVRVACKLDFREDTDGTLKPHAEARFAGLDPKLSYNVTVRSSEGGCSHEVLLPQRACPAKWSSRDVMTWCQTQHVPELVRMTQEYGIDGSTLLSLGEEDLKASGVVAPFLLRRTLNGLATLRAAGT